MARSNLFSVDASTNSMAFGVFEGEALIAHGKINFEGPSVYARVEDAARKCRAFFDKFPDVKNLVIEHTVFINSPKTAADLALVQGALLGAAAQSGITSAGAVNPSAWQSYLGNNRLTKDEQFALTKEFPGKTKSWYKNKERLVRKQRTINLVRINYDRNILDDDIADAVGVGHYAINNWAKVVDKNG
jgi:Holliday junction resolvasome RuvABC endonuclease subunit